MSPYPRPDTIFFIILIFFQTLVLLAFFRHSYRFSAKYKWAVFFLGDVLSCAGIYLLCTYVCDIHMAFLFLYTLLLQFLLCLLLFHENRFYIFLYILFTNVLYANYQMISIHTAYFIFRLQEQRQSLVFLNILMNILFQTTTFLVQIPIIRFIRRNRFYLYLPGGYWFHAYFLYALLYYGSIYVQDLSVKKGFMSALSLLLEIGLLIVSYSLFLMFTILCKNYYEKIQYSLIRQQYSIQKKNFAEIQASVAATRKLRHELKNYILYMNYLLDKKDYEKLNSYFQEFYQKEYPSLVALSTSSSIVDAVIHQKVSLAREAHIRIEDRVTLEKISGIDDLDLCIILSNLMDNAIEACRNTASPVISIKMKPVKNYLSIVICNSVGHNVLIENPKLNSTKQNAEIHGVGIKVVRELVEKYNGSLEFDCSASLFTAKLMLHAREEIHDSYCNL